nr:nitrite reductase small subunit NirD [Streptomyces sp. SN-593]
MTGPPAVTAPAGSATEERPAGDLPGGSATVELRSPGGWFAVCPLDALEPGRGVAVLLPDGAQAALFRLRDGGLYAIGNVDPFTGAGVLSHGLVGSTVPGNRPYVASPLLKQRFDLADGRCLDDDAVSVASYPVRVN